VVTASGDLPIEHAALKDGAVIITTALLPRRREPVDLISARRRGVLSVPAVPARHSRQSRVTYGTIMAALMQRRPGM
jgi:hypothetical protein